MRSRSFAAIRMTVVAMFVAVSARAQSARSYELASLAPQESGAIVDFLMVLPGNSPRVAGAIYEWDKLTDRRSGYSWYTTAPASMLARVAEWRRSHPRPS